MTLALGALRAAKQNVEGALSGFIAEYQKDVGLKAKVREATSKLNAYIDKVKATFKKLEDEAREVHELQRGPFLKLVQDAAKEFEAVDKVADGLVAAVKPAEQP